VASVAVGGGGPANAALFAARILALGDADLTRRLAEFRAGQAEKVAAKDERLQVKLVR
jgi:5-(carboxyamino)imidazole ribonucleotide mutase